MRKGGGAALWRPAIHFLAVADTNHQDDQHFIPDLVDRAIALTWSDVDSVKRGGAFELADAGWTGIAFQPENVVDHVPADVLIEAAKIALGRGRKVNAVPQGLALQIAEKRSKRAGAFSPGLSQSFACLRQIGAIHLFLGEPLEQMQVFHWNDRGEILSAAGYNGPLFSEGGTIDEFREFVASFGHVDARHVRFVRVVRFYCNLYSHRRASLGST